MVRDNRHDLVYLFGAICHARRVGAAIIMPTTNTELMNEHLKEISTQVSPGAHAVLVCDGAGWHQQGKRLRTPHNITLLRLPPYSPELNPIENIWDYLRGNKLTSSAGLSGTASRPSSLPARMLGTSSSAIRSALNPSLIAPGHGSIIRAAGISRGIFDIRLTSPLITGEPSSVHLRQSTPIEFTSLEKVTPLRRPAPSVRTPATGGYLLASLTAVVSFVRKRSAIASGVN